MSIFDPHGFWLFGDDWSKDYEEQEKEHQEELCRLMEQYRAYLGVLEEQKYVLRGSKLVCEYGTSTALLDMPYDYGATWSPYQLPLATCADLFPWNIHHFGSCLCPEEQYAGRLPMTKGTFENGRMAIKSQKNIFAHICVPLIKKDQKWKQIEEELLIEIGKKGYAPMLVDSAVLICQYGGIIRIVEVPDVTVEEERSEVNLTSWLKAYEGEPDASNGIIVTYSFEDREKLKAINPKIDWYSYEDQTEKGEDCEPYLVGQDFVDMGKGVLVDQQDRYWITLGPKVFYPEYPDDGKCWADEFQEYIGCKVDVVLQLMEDEDKHIYIECVWSGHIKAHTYDNGIFQTGVPYPKSNEAELHPFDKDYVNGSIIEFTGKDPEETGDMSKYIVEYLIVYPKE